MRQIGSIDAGTRAPDDIDSPESPIKKIGFGLGFAQEISQDSFFFSLGFNQKIPTDSFSLGYFFWSIIYQRNQDISEDSFLLAWMVLTLIVIVFWDISWSEFVLVPFQGLLFLILIVALDIPGQNMKYSFPFRHSSWFLHHF